MKQEGKPNPVPTMEQEWQTYFKQCYPFPIPAEQSREIHQAFFAGALVAMQKPDQLLMASVKVGEFKARAEALMAEVVNALQGIAAARQNREQRN